MSGTPQNGITRKRNMTMPCERFRSIEKTRAFLTAINRGELTDLDEIREQAYRCLRHFPWETHMNDVAKKAPDTFTNPEQLSWVIWNKGKRELFFGTKQQAQRYCVLNGPDCHLGEEK